MSDSIDRRAAIDAVELITWYHQNRNGEMVEGANSQEHQAWYKAEDVYKVLNDLPSAQDIIRCKNCKHHGADYCHHPRLYGNHFLAGDDDYCSWAEQEEEG